MKKLKAYLITFLFSYILSGCNQPTVLNLPRIGDSSDAKISNQDSISAIPNSNWSKPAFNVQKFVLLTDSFLTQVENRIIKLTFKTDTLKNDTVRPQSFFNSLFTSNRILATKYSFVPPIGSKALRFWFIEALYEDNLATNEAFEKLISQSGKVEIENDNLPGLTYTNDYVIKAENKILWLNTGCTYSFANHKKMKEIMMHSLPPIYIQDSIWCRCGQVKCSFEN